MSVAALIRREFVDRRRVFVFAAAIGLLALLVPLLIRSRHIQYADARDLMTAIAACGVGFALALMMGQSVIGRDLVEGRLSFYLNRPISDWALWVGRFVASVLVSFCAALTVVLMATLSGGGFIALLRRGGTETATALGLLLGGVVLLFLVAHFLGTVIRSRSMYVLIDFAGAVVTGAIIWAIVRASLAHGSLRLLEAGFSLLIFLVPFAIFIAGGFQIGRGRSDIRRSHRALSITAWSVILTGVLSVAAFAAWLAQRDPRELEVATASASPNGEWISLMGSHEATDWSNTALVHLSTGKSHSIRNLGAPLAFSRDGRRVVWLEPEMSLPGNVTHRLMWAELSGNSATIHDAGFDTGYSSLVVSPSGRRVAILDSKITIFDLDGGRVIGAAQVSDARAFKAYFETEDLLRMVVRGKDESTALYQFDTGTRKLQRTGELPREAGILGVDVAQRLIVVKEILPVPQDATPAARGSRFRGPIRLRDAVSGAVTATIAERAGFGALMLADGSIAVTSADDETAPVNATSRTLSVVRRDGSVVREIPLGTFASLSLASEVRPGVIAFRATPAMNELTRDSWEVDVASGKIRKVEGLYPLVGHGRIFGPDPSVRVEPGSPAAGLMYGRDRGLVAAGE